MFDWTSTSGVDAVIVKGGRRRLVSVSLRPADGADVRQRAHHPEREGNAISHVSFCYDGDEALVTVVKTRRQRQRRHRGRERLDDERRRPDAALVSGGRDRRARRRRRHSRHVCGHRVGWSIWVHAHVLGGLRRERKRHRAAVPRASTCILTNDDNACDPDREGKITVVKQLPRRLQPRRATSLPGTGAVDAGIRATVRTDLTVNAGTYTVTESLAVAILGSHVDRVPDDNSSGEHRDALGDVQGRRGEHGTCMFTNQKRSIMIVKKVDLNPTGHEATAGDFTVPGQRRRMASRSSTADGENQSRP